MNATDSPWRNLREGAKRIQRGPRWLAKQCKAGRVRHARIGGKGEIVFRDEWLDAFMESLSTPVEVFRRRA